MKHVTLFLAALLTTGFMAAQVTYNLDWAVGINGEDASVTIEVGDSVEWTWTDNLPHTVTSLAGATEAFDSGTITGNGETYTYTFTMEGVNPYDCVIHPATMFGTITVEAALSVEDKFAINVNAYPNPVLDKLTVTSLFSLDSYTVFDILGKQVQSGQINANIASVDFSKLTSGMYFVNVQSGELQKTIKVMKR